MQVVEEAIALVQKHSWHGATIGALGRTDRWKEEQAGPGNALRG